ncbi:hypothetical protein AB1N83_003466 [Pleurotus pulmonarius]
MSGMGERWCVTDPDLRVNAVRGIRVVVPRIPSAHTQRKPFVVKPSRQAMAISSASLWLHSDPDYRIACQRYTLEDLGLFVAEWAGHQRPENVGYGQWSRMHPFVAVRH